MSDELFELPRWKNGPKICVATNLPAFETVADARNLTRTVEGDSLKESWTCSVCGMIHAEYRFRSPAGDSSGNPRSVWPQGSIKKAKALAVVEKIGRPE